MVEMDFYRKCYDIDSSNLEGNTLLLKSIFNWLYHCEHEWPAGILYGMDGASIEECKAIRKEISFASTLITNQYECDFLEQFLVKLSQYEQRFNKAIN